MKTIETRYKGYRFRSRLEARWAVFFDALGIKWEYEPEGFELGFGERYLPDFWLPNFCCEKGLYVEVKPEADVFRKAKLFSKRSGHLVLFAEGTPEARVYEMCDAGEETDGVFYDKYLSKNNEYRMYMGCGAPTVDWPLGIDEAVNAARGARFEFGEQG